MSPETWQSLRWLVALVVALLVVVITVPLALDAVLGSLHFGDEEVDPEAGETADGAGNSEDGDGQVPSGPVEDGSASAEADFVVRAGTVAQESAAELSLAEEDDTAVLAFPLIDGDPECVEVAELQVQLLEADATELHVYASDIANPRDLDDGEEVSDPRRDEEIRSVAVTDGSPGRLLWDVTGLYQDWARGDLAPLGSRLTLVIALPEATSVVLGASESDDEAPALAWEGVADCG